MTNTNTEHHVSPNNVQVGIHVVVATYALIQEAEDRKDSGRAQMGEDSRDKLGGSWLYLDTVKRFESAQWTSRPTYIPNISIVLTAK